MPKKLVVVESIAKIKTISKYLGKDYLVIASSGHIRDLPKKNGSIDIEHDFKPTYQLIATKKRYIDTIIADSKQVEQIFLATDPDREGESIAWHICEILKKHKIAANKTIKRISFNEITEKAVLNAVNNPRELDLDLIEAQQSRLTLDYLIGFNISPLLWRKIKPGLSAGRVQSPALRLICEREEEIKSFTPEDYFTLHLHTQKAKIKFQAKLIQYQKKKLETRTITLLAEAQNILAALKNGSSGKITDIVKQQKKKNPNPPFITSSLQIEAARKHGFGTDKTMKVAQSLYEGIEINGEAVGLISYMRTDSVNLSDTAITDIRNFISENYANEYLPPKPLTYVGKVKNAQEAHEAIRPTSIFRTPSSIEAYLNADQFKLYELIWLRTVACQLSPCILDTTKVDIKIADGIFRANGLTVNFDGFMKVYQEAQEDVSKDDDDSDNKLPPLTVGEELPIDKIDIASHQTEPKPRFSEAGLVKTLEELGIGRPSTFVSIISTLKKREYVILDKKRFVPTDIGNIVNQFLVSHLTAYVDYKFTANMEDTLDDISNGIKERVPVLTKFWQDLDKNIQEKQNIARSELTAERLDENCPLCSKQLLLRLGRYGRFIGCSGYPDCNYMRKVDKDNNAVTEEPEVITDRNCPKDGGVLVIRNGKFGKFISCKNYPKCKYIENINNPNDNGEQITCPECKNGQIVAKKNRFGNWFYACNNYPQCKTLFNHKPVATPCPNCNYALLLQKVSKTKGSEEICPKCDFHRAIATDPGS